MVEPVSATVLATGLAADFFAGWLAKKAFFQGCRTVKDTLDCCLEKDLVKTTQRALGLLAGELRQGSLGMFEAGRDPGWSAQAPPRPSKVDGCWTTVLDDLIMGLMLYAETACASLQKNGPATEKRLRSFVPRYASLDKKRAQIELIVCSFIRSAQHKTLLEKIESKTAEYAEDILWDTIEEPLKEAVGAIVQDVMGSAVPDALSLFIHFLEVV
ncbi:unnamed protein product [Symbiodinium necroappetens]|uniref:Uncharacterized protein n=1 Tax=Symbiodinium necroappetens TaxID=1628268 RepID=A0A812L257_9DINO|nr:unnamed protein product [Symbiodinium necroappetens]